jgi:hypothetical protein
MKRLPALPVRINDPRPRSTVDLALRPRQHFHAAERNLDALFTLPGIPLDRFIASNIGQSVGSGAIESTCWQYQRRLKMTGPFWSLEGDEAFLARSTLHRNGRWNKLLPRLNSFTELTCASDG